jgi:hypothetical protein
MDMSRVKPSQGWQGRQELNPHSRFWRPLFCPLNYVPRDKEEQRKTARQVSLRAAPVNRLEALRRNLLDAMGIRGA